MLHGKLPLLIERYPGRSKLEDTSITAGRYTADSFSRLIRTWTRCFRTANFWLSLTIFSLLEMPPLRNPRKKLCSIGQYTLLPI